MSAPLPLYNLLDDPPGSVGLGMKTYYAPQAILVNMNFECPVGCGNATYQLIQTNVGNGNPVNSTTFSGMTLINVYPFETKIVIKPFCGGKQCGQSLIFKLKCNTPLCQQ